MADTAPLVIVGTGLAGYNLAKEFRKLDSQRPMLLVSADDGRFYSKPLLSTGFAKGKEADELAMQDASAMAAQLGADAVGLGVVAPPVFLHDFVLRRAGGVAGRVEHLRRLQLQLHGEQSPHAGGLQ